MSGQVSQVPQAGKQAGSRFDVHIHKLIAFIILIEFDAWDILFILTRTTSVSMCVCVGVDVGVALAAAKSSTYVLIKEHRNELGAADCGIHLPSHLPHINCRH